MSSTISSSSTAAAALFMIPDRHWHRRRIKSCEPGTSRCGDKIGFISVTNLAKRDFTPVISFTYPPLLPVCSRSPALSTCVQVPAWFGSAVAMARNRKINSPTARFLSFLHPPIFHLSSLLSQLRPSRHPRPHFLLSQPPLPSPQLSSSYLSAWPNG
jgi:hypothetical protein